MQNDKLLKMAAICAIPALFFVLPAPEGLSLEAWRTFGFYLAAIMGLILKPYAEPVVILTMAALSGLFLKNFSGILVSGYASSTVWLVFAAFSLSTAFVKTKLGTRLAYILMGKIGHSTLGMGYVIAFLELIVAPVTPSSTARAGGIIFPIVNSVAVALGSEPGPTRRRAGAYFMVSLYMLTKTSSYIFMTGMAPNVLAAKFAGDILGVRIDWMLWFKAALVPGFLLMLVIPWVIYLLYPPELKKIDGKALSKEGLEKLGPMSTAEKVLTGIFIVALIGWIVGPMFKLNEANIAVAAMCACMVFNVITWDDMAGNKGAWRTLMWFGGIVGIAGALAKAKFFVWLAAFLSVYLKTGASSYVMLAVIIVLSVLVRYIFASSTAYVVSMTPVFCTVGLAAGVEPMTLALALVFSNGYGSMVTHFGAASGPILFGSGYPDLKNWWTVGAVCAALSVIVHLTLGVAWWKMLGLV